eukprot:11046026-Alexandrium_andersonii.AAC.1
MEVAGRASMWVRSAQLGLSRRASSATMAGSPRGRGPTALHRSPLGPLQSRTQNWRHTVGED